MISTSLREYLTVSLLKSVWQSFLQMLVFKTNIQREFCIYKHLHCLKRPSDAMTHTLVIALFVGVLRSYEHHHLRRNARRNAHWHSHQHLHMQNNLLILLE